MTSAEDFMLIALHAHIVAVAKVIQDLHPTLSVTELAHLIVTNYTRLPKVEDAENLSTSEVHLYATELLSLGMGTTMPSEREKGKGGCYGTGSFYL